METNLQDKKFERTQLTVSGLGGWLTFVQIGLYATLFLTGIQVVFNLLPAFKSETWTLLTSKDSEFYHALWAPLITFEAVYNIALIAFCIYILTQLYAKKWILPRLMIIFYAGSLLFGFLDYILLQQIPVAREMADDNSLRDLYRSGLTCLIWIPYFMRSVRVKNTFVR